MFKNIPLFSCLDQESLAYLKKVAQEKTFPKNSMILNKGDETDSLYIIYKGKVKIVIIDESGREAILSIHGPGDILGEMALLDSKPRSATIMTKEKTQLLVIQKRDFNHILSVNPDLMFNLLKLLLEKFRKTNEQVANLMFKDTYGRVATLFLQLSEPVETDDSRMIKEKLTHQEIANMVGASREMVSKILKELMVEGYITIGKKSIIINKKLPYAY